MPSRAHSAKGTHMKLEPACAKKVTQMKMPSVRTYTGAGNMANMPARDAREFCCSMMLLPFCVWT